MDKYNQITELNKIGEYTSKIISCDFIKGDGDNNIDIKNNQIIKISKEEELSFPISKILKIIFTFFLSIFLIILALAFISSNGPVHSILSTR